MKRYTILSIIKTVNGVNHRYDAVRTGMNYTGSYTCPTLDEGAKIVTDFICMSNTYINSVKDNTTNLSFAIGETTPQGRVTGFKPVNSSMEVFVNNARVNTIPLANLRKAPAAAPVQAVPVAVRPVVTTAPVAQSRSQAQAISPELLAIEKRILGNEPIRLEKLLKKTIPATLKDFLIKFFETYNGEKNTIYVESKRVQTQTGRKRSLGDIYFICKYYFPDCTLKQVLTLLYTTLPAHYGARGFRTSYCNVINKRVWYYSSGSASQVYDIEVADEFGKKVPFYREQIS